ncbi:MAG: hypothetical protein HYT40_02100, partial [Candidatus Sungbacteria bacterium]|nr:hypothetical protein [Candidatus Sungbacteria bacterium]
MSNIKWFNYTEEKSKTDLYAHNESMLNLSQKEFIKELDLAWFNFFVKNAPNGRVLISNTYNLDFKRIMLVHLTPSFNEILKTGKVFASGGGLGAAVYCSPVHQDNTVHNIFEQYFFFQLPKNTKKKISAICIEITPDKENTTNVKNWGVDYTNFGEIECQTWKNLKPQIDVSFIKELEKRVFNQIMNNKELINTFVGYKLDKLSYGEFEQVYDNLFAKIPSLRFISYEVLAEYILLFQDNKKAYDYSFKGELYNLPHKKFISDLCPSMLKKFNMIDFFISLNKISQYLHSSDIFKQFNQEQFINFIKWRIGFYL